VPFANHPQFNAEELTMTPTFSGLLRSLLDRLRVMFIAAAVATAKSLGVDVRKDDRPPRGESLYLAWCGHW
jgi:hypothetical protein